MPGTFTEPYDGTYWASPAANCARLGRGPILANVFKEQENSGRRPAVTLEIYILYTDQILCMRGMRGE